MSTKFKVESIPGLFILIYHLILLLALPTYLCFRLPAGGMIGWTLALVWFSGIGITGGYHRYYSHKTFQMHPVLEPVFLFFSTLAAQGSVLRWSYDHRLHHAFVDTDRDPYSIKKGFWYAHMLWLFEKSNPIDPKVIPDLVKRPVLRFQDKYYGILLVLTNAVVFGFFGWLYQDYLGALVFIVLFRMFLLHHLTWFINSLAHTWGDKPFSEEHSAVNNYIISFLTFGEGYHNFHHTFANDYRNGVRWYQFDPTKWMLWSFEKLGLAWGLKRTDAFAIRKKMVLERKELLLKRLKEVWYIRKEELEAKLQERSDRMVDKMNRLNKLLKEYRLSKKRHEAKEMLNNLKAEIKKLRKSLKEDWKEWSYFTQNLMKLRALPA